MNIIMETGRLLHICFFSQDTMQESIADVHLTHMPSTKNSQRKHKTHRGWLDDRRKRIRVINAMLLSKPASNEASFEFVQGSIRLVLHFKYPLTTNDVLSSRTRGMRDQVLLR